MTEVKPAWKRYRFEEMVTSVGATRKARGWSYSQAGIDRYVGLEHLDSDSLKIRRWGSPEDVGENSDLRLFEPGDVIFARRRIEQRKVGLADFHGIASGHALVFRARPTVVLPEFLPFFMQAVMSMGRAAQLSVGSLSPTINWNTLAKQEFVLPPLEEQQRAAKLLDHILELDESLREAEVFAGVQERSLLSAHFLEHTQRRLSVMDYVRAPGRAHTPKPFCSHFRGATPLRSFPS